MYTLVQAPETLYACIQVCVYMYLNMYTFVQVHIHMCVQLYVCTALRDNGGRGTVYWPRPNQQELPQDGHYLGSGQGNRGPGGE